MAVLDELAAPLALFVVLILYGAALNVTRQRRPSARPGVADTADGTDRGLLPLLRRGRDAGSPGESRVVPARVAL